MQRKLGNKQAFVINNTRGNSVSSLSKNISKMRARAHSYHKALKKTRDKLEKMELVQYLEKELAYISLARPPYTESHNVHWIERLFWAVSVFLSFVLAFYLIVLQFVRLSEAPIVMSVDMDYFNWNMSYPAFTLCPNIKYDPEAFATLLNETNARTGKDLEPYLQTIVSVNMDNLGVVDLDFSPDIIKLIDPKEYAGIAMAVFKKFDNGSMTTNTNSPIATNEVITEFGTCHVVNSNVAVLSNPNGWNRTFTYQKNNIELSFHDQGFFVQVQDYADIYKVFIHSPDEPIISSTPSYTHSLKGFASFGVIIWNSKISEGLHGFPLRLRKCRYLNEPVGLRYPIYSYNFCLLECRIKMILKLCGCVPHFYKPLDSEETCSLIDLQCVNEHKKEILSLSTSKKTLHKFSSHDDLPRASHDCGCISECNSDSYQKEYENFVSQSTSNRLRVGIYAFPKFRLVREFIFKFTDIVLRMGGVINLCTGASVISLIELAVIILKIPLHPIYRTLKEKWLRKAV